MNLLHLLIVLLCPVSTVFQFGVHSGSSIWLHQCFVLLHDQPFKLCTEKEPCILCSQFIMLQFSVTLYHLFDPLLLYCGC
jgi:hypothetical protein